MSSEISESSDGIFAKTLADGVFVYPVEGAKKIITEMYGAKFVDALYANENRDEFNFLYRKGINPISVLLNLHTIEFTETSLDDSVKLSDSDVVFSKSNVYSGKKDFSEKNVVNKIPVTGLKINSVKMMKGYGDYSEYDLCDIEKKLGDKYFRKVEDFLKEFHMTGQILLNTADHDKATSYIYQ